MPRYDYECQRCHHRFELKQSFSSDPVANCPVCRNGARRVIHSVPVMFKGSGWYVNDYGKGWTSGATNGQSKPSTEESDSKPKAKAESTSEPNKEKSKKKGASVRAEDS